MAIKSVLRTIHSENAFHINNGPSINSLSELASQIGVLSAEQFSFHVNENKNDFSAWIFGVVGDEKLAAEIKDIKDQSQLAEMVKIRISTLKDKMSQDSEPAIKKEAIFDREKELQANIASKSAKKPAEPAAEKPKTIISTPITKDKAAKPEPEKNVHPFHKNEYSKDMVKEHHAFLHGISSSITNGIKEFSFGLVVGVVGALFLLRILA